MEPRLAAPLRELAAAAGAFISETCAIFAVDSFDSTLMMSRRRTSTGSFSIASSIHFSRSSGSSMLLGPAAAGAAAGAAASDIGGAGGRRWRGWRGDRRAQCGGLEALAPL